MTTFMKRLAGYAAIAALAMPAVAQAGGNPAAKLSTATSVRAPAKVQGKSKLFGGSTLINVLIFAAIGGGILVATTTGGNDSPSSP